MSAYKFSPKYKTESILLLSCAVGMFGFTGDALAKDSKKGKSDKTAKTSKVKKVSKSSSKIDFSPRPFVTRVKGADKLDRSKAVDSEVQDEVDKLQKMPEDVDHPDTDEFESRDPNFFLKRARVFVKHKMYRRALIDLNKCLSLSPNSWDAKYIGAYIYQLQGRVDEAIDRYRYLLKIKPDNILAHINIGSLLRQRHQYDLAEKHYRKAVSINHYSLKAHYNLANVLADQHRLEEALKELKICVKLKPKNAWVHNNLGVLYQKINYHEEAEEEFLKAITLEPTNKQFVTNLKLLRENKETYQAQADAADLL